MRKIQILGPGCPNCERLVALADRVARELGIEYEIEKIKEITEIVQFGVMATPGLVLDGKVLVSGRVPSEAEVKEWLS